MLYILYSITSALSLQHSYITTWQITKRKDNFIQKTAPQSETLCSWQEMLPAGNVTQAKGLFKLM